MPKKDTPAPVRSLSRPVAQRASVQKAARAATVSRDSAIGPAIGSAIDHAIDSAVDANVDDDGGAVDAVGEALTDKQRRVLAFISARIRAQGYPPTVREIMHELSLHSTNGVNDHLKALERKGYLRREGNKSRALRVVRDLEGQPVALGTDGASPAPSNVFPLRVTDDDDMIDVPLLGRVAAGVPILAEEHAEDTVKVSSFFLGKGARSQKVFALKVVGESMIEDGIFDGDFLFVEKTPVARAGDIVVVMIEGEATVKRFYPEGDRIRLQPANARMEPIFVHKREFRQTDVLGLVVGVYRRM